MQGAWIPVRSQANLPPLSLWPCVYGELPNGALPNLLIFKSLVTSPGEGTHMSEVYGYVPLWQPPFLGSSAAPETHLFTPSVSFYALHFPFFKKLAFLGPFLSDFGKFSAPNTLILAKICSQDPSMLRKKIRSVDPTFENPCGTCLPKKKKKLSAPFPPSPLVTPMWPKV